MNSKIMNNKTEESFKAECLTAWGFVAGKDYTLGRIDAKLKNIWIEAKKGAEDIDKMLAQIIFTARIQSATLCEALPPYLGCFNQLCGAIIHEDDIHEALSHPSVNWNQTPSKINEQTVAIIASTLKNKQIFYNLTDFGKALKQIASTNYLRQSEITKNNVISIYHDWLATIGKILTFRDPKILENLKADCFLADIMIDEEGDKTITQKLTLIRRTVDREYYYIPRDRTGFDLKDDIKITNYDVYNTFWNKYKRPPAQDFRNLILTRRDLLVFNKDRQKNGAFYTPSTFSQESKKYLAKAFGEDWQDNYYIWDCCCGTGNLEVGLINQERVFMSDIMHQCIDIIKESCFMPDSTLFQFDFLNDEWKPLSQGGKIPNNLWQIIQNEPQKLIIYINPPYKEDSNKETMLGKTTNYAGLTQTITKGEMKTDNKNLGRASNELFVQFYYNIYTRIKGCKIAAFSTLKNCVSPNFEGFRSFFKAKFCGGFICKSNTFDNVKGQFPISFQIWDCALNLDFKKSLTFDVYDTEGSKTVFATDKKDAINTWFYREKKDASEILGYCQHEPGDFSHQNGVYFVSTKPTRPVALSFANLEKALIYLALRHCIKCTWINDRDQLLHPTKIVKTTDDTGLYANESGESCIHEYEYQKDTNFIANCVAFALFHRQNHADWCLFKDSELGLHSSGRDLSVYNFVMQYQFGETASKLLEAARQIYMLYYSKIHQSITNYSVSRKIVWQTLKDNDEFKTLKTQFTTLQNELASEIAFDMIGYGFYRV